MVEKEKADTCHYSGYSPSNYYCICVPDRGHSCFARNLPIATMTGFNSKKRATTAILIVDLKKGSSPFFHFK